MRFIVYTVFDIREDKGINIVEYYLCVNFYGILNVNVGWVVCYRRDDDFGFFIGFLGYWYFLGILCELLCLGFGLCLRDKSEVIFLFRWRGRGYVFSL